MIESDHKKIHDIIGEWCGEGTIGTMRRKIVEYIAEVRKAETEAALKRHSKALCGFCESGIAVHFVPEANCFKHHLDGETPWTVCHANDIRMSER